MADIQQVDVPGLLSLYTGVKQQSLENQYRATQIEKMRRDNQLQEMRRTLIGKVFSGTPASQPASTPTAPDAPASSSSSTPPASAEELEQFMPGRVPGMLANGKPTSSLTEGNAGAPPVLVDPQHLPPRTDGLSINQDALRQLYAIDPEGAYKIQQHIYDADKDMFERVKARGTTMAQVAGALLQEPTQEGRITALRQAAPQLQALGFTPEQLNQVDLSDAGLSRYFRAGQSMEQIISEKKDARDYALRKDQAEETVRHNRATEGVAGGNLALARQREGRITRWGPQSIILGAGVPRSDTGDLDY